MIGDGDTSIILLKLHTYDKETSCSQLTLSHGHLKSCHQNDWLLSNFQTVQSIMFCVK